MEDTFKVLDTRWKYGDMIRQDDNSNQPDIVVSLVSNYCYIDTGVTIAPMTCEWKIGPSLHNRQ